MQLPSKLVVSLEHARFDMRCHEPVVAARVEVVWVSGYRHFVFDLLAGSQGPLVHQVA